MNQSTKLIQKMKQRDKERQLFLNIFEPLISGVNNQRFFCAEEIEIFKAFARY